MSVYPPLKPDSKLLEDDDEVQYIRKPDGSISREVRKLHTAKNSARATRICRRSRVKYHDGIPHAPLPYPWSIEGLYEHDDNEKVEGLCRVPIILRLGYETSMKLEEARRFDHKPHSVVEEKPLASTPAWPLAGRCRLSPLKTPQSTQYLMCGKKPDLAIPDWLSSPPKGQLVDVWLPRRSHDIKLSGGNSNLIEQINSPYSDKKPSGRGTFITEVDEDETTSCDVQHVKRDLLKTVPRAIQLIRSTQSQQQKSTLLAHVEQLLREKLKPGSQKKTQLSSITPPSAARWQKPLDPLSSLLKQLQVYETDNEPSGYQDLPQHHKQHCFLTQDHRLSHPQLSEGTLDQGSRPKQIACEIREMVAAEARPLPALSRQRITQKSTPVLGIPQPFHPVRRESSLQRSIQEKTPTDILNQYLNTWGVYGRLNRAGDLMLKPNHRCLAGNRRKLGTLRSRH